MGSSCLMEIVSFGEDEKLTIDDDDGYLIIWMYLTSQKCTLENGHTSKFYVMNILSR